MVGPRGPAAPVARFGTVGRALRLVGTLAVPPIAGGLFVFVQVMRAAHRSDLPSFTNQDASGTFGDPALPRLRIVAVGDSSLTGPGIEDPGNIFASRLARSAADRYRVELISLGVGGSKARDVIEGQLAEALRLRPDLAIVSVVTNDAIRATTLRAFRRDLDLILGRLEEVAAAVVLLGMGDPGSVPRLPPTIRPFVTWQGERFNGACVEVATRHPRTIKVHSRGRMTSAFWEDRSLFAGDLFHANDRGHALFAEESRDAFEAALQMVEQRRNGRKSRHGLAAH
jgi:lysophospholipase L1-like esterase